MIEVGEYVRTDKGYIVKIDKEKKNLQMLKFLDVEYGNILKRSKNIIDLIEVGDCVRLFMEDDIDEEDTNIFELIAITNDKKEIGILTKDFEIEFFPIENLRGIVTKEQFVQMEYKVKE